MSSGLLDIVKIASKEAMEAGQPTDLRFGVVTSVKPLKVQISSQLTIPSSLLVVPKHLTDHEVEVEIDWTTAETSGGGESYSAFASHNHKITGKKKIKVRNALKKDDKVALLRKAGGQQFFILDRI